MKGSHLPDFAGVWKASLGKESISSVLVTASESVHLSGSGKARPFCLNPQRPITLGKSEDKVPEITQENWTSHLGKEMYAQCQVSRFLS